MMAASSPDEMLSEFISGLGRTVLLAEIREPRDDWTLVTSTAERKRRQNRLNQRAYRILGRRKQAAQQRNRSSGSHAVDCSRQELVAREGTTSLVWKYDTPSEADDIDRGYLLPPCPAMRDMIYTFMREAYEQYSLRAPRPEQLPMLIRLNVLNALSRNAAVLGFPVDSLCRDEYISPFNQHGPRLGGDAISLPPCPRSLIPTALQISVTHHPWIDLFPMPRMRDNVLNGLAAGLLDEDELCLDFLGVDDTRQDEKPALIVWGPSWDPQSWEANAAFLRKWGWLVSGCPEILSATNFWRRKKGEKELDFTPYRF